MADLSQALAFKAYEIEELADVYFFRPVGSVFAYAARLLGLTPNAVTIASAIAGAIGGALLYSPDEFWVATFLCLMLYSVLDAADGQLARLTGTASDFGRLVDGIAGYVVHVALYLGLAAGIVARGGSRAILWWLVPSALSNAVHSQLYDYYRTSYSKLAIKGIVSQDVPLNLTATPAGRVLRAYHAAQRHLNGEHGKVERAIAARAQAGVVRESDRARYRACFYWPVRGWNVLGENTRWYAIAVLGWLHHADWFFVFSAVPMNAVCLALWFWQRAADRRFLAL